MPTPNRTWAVATLLAAVICGLEDKEEPPAMGTGNLYGVGEPLATTLEKAIELARADTRIVEILGEDAVYDFAEIASAEWCSFITHVSDWDHQRYLEI